MFSKKPLTLHILALAALATAGNAHAATYCSRILPPVKVVAVGDSITENHSIHIIDGLNETTLPGGASYINATFGAYDYEVTHAGQGGASFRLAGANYRAYPTFISGSTVYERGIKYVRGINALGDHYVIGLGTNDAKTGTNNVTAATEAGWRNIYTTGVNAALFGGTTTQNADLTHLPFGAAPLPATTGTRNVPILGYAQLAHEPHIFINKITWGDASRAINADQQKTVFNVNNYFARFAKDAATTVGAHSIDLFAVTNGQSQLLGDYVHLTNTGASLVGKTIGRGIPDLARLPDIVPCAPTNITLPTASSTAYNLELRMANLGKVASSGYALGLELTLPSTVKVQRSSTLTVAQGGVNYPLVPTYGTVGTSMVCYWLGMDSSNTTQKVHCDAKNNAGSHTYKSATYSATPPTVNPILSLTQSPATASAVPPLVIQPAIAFPSNQAIFHIKLQRQGEITALPKNGSVEVFYGGKEFSRSNNKISFSVQ